MKAIAGEAHDCIARGWRVLPIAPGTKRPAAGYGLRHLCATHEDVDAWGQHPAAGVAIACRPSGLLVLDADRRAGADLAALERAADLPPTRRVRTPGGTHTYFLHPEFPVRGTIAHAGFVGYDVKAEGYVLSPPSRHPSGARYVLVDDEPPAPMPDWLAALVRLAPAIPRPTAATIADSEVLVAVRAEYARLATAPRGRRNSTAYLAANTLGGIVAVGRLAHHDALDVLRDAARACHLIDEEPAATEATLRRGLNDGKQHPPRLPQHAHARQLRAAIDEHGDAARQAATLNGHGALLPIAEAIA